MQITTAKRVYSAINSPVGSVLYPRFQPRGKQQGVYILLPRAYFPYAADWYRHVIHNNPNQNPASLSFKDMAYASPLSPQHTQTWKGDLSAFKNRGAKVLTYHGQAGPLISSDNSPRYYEHVVNTMEMQPSELDDFYRFLPHRGNRSLFRR
jgi:feruloyl esterase